MEKTKETNHEMEAEKNSYSHILKYTGLLGGVQGLNMLVGIVRNKFTAMFLGPSGMGLLSLFNATSGFLPPPPISAFLPVASGWFPRLKPGMG